MRIPSLVRLKGVSSNGRSQSAPKSPTLARERRRLRSILDRHAADLLDAEKRPRFLIEWEDSVRPSTVRVLSAPAELRSAWEDLGFEYGERWGGEGVPSTWGRLAHPFLETYIGWIKGMRASFQQELDEEYLA
jgi:hypothetical protein